MKAEISEKLIACIWQRQLATAMITNDGKQVKVIYPGRASNGNGCDFQDAVFTIDDNTITGNIELHVKSSQWYSHGHHRDPKYNAIVLHVAMWHDSPSPTLLQNGKAVPTICLSSFLGDTLDKLRQVVDSPCCLPPSCPQVTKLSNTESLIDLLTIAGKERFAAKTASFRRSLKKEDAGQVLFRGLARALGYAQNSKPFEELANSICLRLLESEPQTDAIKQAWILGTAGLLPSQRSKLRHQPIEDGETEKLETIWRSSGMTQTMKEGDWCFFRVRPDNFPTRRLAALSYILSRYSKAGLLRGLRKLVEEAPAGAKHRWLENGVTITAHGYWANHSDFGLAKKRSSAIVGEAKAAEIAINTIVPFFYAWGGISAELKLKKKAALIYHCYPKLEDNELTNHMKQQLLLKPNARLSACQHQGLIHIFNTYCRHRNCTECPVTLSQS